MSNAYCESLFSDVCFLNLQRIFGSESDFKQENSYIVRTFILIIHEMAHRLRFIIGCEGDIYKSSPFIYGINKSNQTSMNKNNVEIGYALEYLLFGVIFKIFQETFFKISNKIKCVCAKLSL